jgi:hypothetical protein
MKIWDEDHDEQMRQAHEQVSRSAQRLLDALPAAQGALQDALDRLERRNTPWYARAWHRLVALLT